MTKTNNIINKSLKSFATILTSSLRGAKRRGNPVHQIKTPRIRLLRYARNDVHLRSNKSKGILAVILSITLIFSFTLPTLSQADEAYAGEISALAYSGWYETYTGAQADPYILMSNEDIITLAQKVNGGEDFFEKFFTLDTDLSFLNTAPIGNKDNPFNGTFDGNGKEIGISQINVPANKKYVGLFGYTGADSIIKNLNLDAGTLSVTESSASGQQIRYVGSIVGYAEGDIENCNSWMNISISSNMTLGTNKGIIRDIGGIVGYTTGDMNSCKNYGDISIASNSNINDDIRYLLGEVGGIAGAQGDVTDLLAIPKTEDCFNYGNFFFNVTGSGGTDRFGQQLFSVSANVGGIIGHATGTVSRCTNNGSINTSNGDAENPEEGRGGANTGGIVGCLRGIDFDKTAESSANANMSGEDAAYKYYTSNGGAAASTGTPGIGSLPKTSGIYDCTNTGDVIGLAAVGGIVGNAGTFTEIEGCANTNTSAKGGVKGCRWNKPFAGGIAGNTQGDVRYCYNRANVWSVTGGGYYCTGLVSGLWSANTSITEDNDRVPTTELTGCYVTGKIYTSDAGFRTGILAGENEGFIHDNVYLSGLTVDNKVVDVDSGTLKNNTQVTTAQLQSSMARGLLNSYAAGKGKWAICYLPDKAVGSGAVNAGYPVLSRGALSTTDAVVFPAATAVLSDGGDASYSATSEPIPRISLILDAGSVALVQNADFRVIPETNAKAVTLGLDSPPDTRPYSATIEGIGAYKDMLGGATPITVPYGIKKAEISDCTIVSEAAMFNWERQSPIGRTKLIDSAGNEVTTAEYIVNDLYDEYGGTSVGLDVNPSPSITDWRYYDYKNAHGPNYKYDVKVTAKSTSNYVGSSVQPAFRIKWASMMAQLPVDDPEYDPALPERVTYGKVTWQGQTWDFIPAMRDTSGNTIQITYTGKPITPTVTSVKYLGKELTLATDYEYQSHPLDYDYKYIYGNPNPETTGGLSTEPINVTPSTPTCMTVRFTNGGNFDNYSNVFFRIVPADISSAKITIPSQTYSGKALKPKPVVTFGDGVLKEGTDYTISNLAYKSNTVVGNASVQFTINGKGNFKGVAAKTVGFKIAAKSIASAKTSISIANQKYTGKVLKPSLKPTVKIGNTTLKLGKDYSLTSIKWKTNKGIGKATVTFTVKGKGNYKDSLKAKTISFKINPKANSISKLTPVKKGLKVSFKKVSAAQKVTSYQISYRVKGAAKWKTVSVSAKKSNVALKSLKKGKTYQVRVRAVKKIAKGTSKGTYYGNWSAVKTSKKVK